jgi:hypothetical protein
MSLADSGFYGGSSYACLIAQNIYKKKCITSISIMLPSEQD